MASTHAFYQTRSMNDNTPHSTPPGQHPDPPAGGFFTWIRGLGLARSGDRWFAGVAGGIAAKAGIDPLIIRGIFVVLTVLGGSGVLLYILGWLFLPDQTAKIHAEEIIRGRAATWVVVTAIIFVVLIIFPVLFGISGFGVSPTDGSWGWTPWGVPDWISVMFSVFWWIAIIGGGIWLLVWAVNRKPQEPGSGSSSGQDPASDASTPPGATGTPGATFGAANAQTTEQPAGNQSFGNPDSYAHTWTDQSGYWGAETTTRATTQATAQAELQQARKLDAGQVIVSIALALLAGGIAAIWAAGGMTNWWQPTNATDPARVLTFGLVAAVAVLALSIIVAGIRGRTTGWVGFLAACGIVALLVTSVFPSGARLQPFGTATVTCCDVGVDAGTAEGGLVVLAGNARLDLSELDGTTRNSEYEVWLAAGNVRVQLPENHPTIVNVQLLAGNIREERPATNDERLAQSGPFLSRTVTANLSGADPDDISSVDIRVIAGNVRVIGADEDTLGAQPLADGESSAEADLSNLIDERDELRDELDQVEWELMKPSATERELFQLERQQTRLEAQLDKLEKEITQ